MGLNVLLVSTNIYIYLGSRSRSEGIWEDLQLWAQFLHRYWTSPTKAMVLASLSRDYIFSGFD